MLQDAIARLSPYDKKDYSDRTVLVGASPFCKVPIYQRKASTEDTKGGKIVNYLKKHKLTKEEDVVFEVLEQWCQNQPLSVWMSRSLPVDMNLPVTSPCPRSLILQALVLCVGRPAILLSLYTHTSQQDTDDIIASRKRPYHFPAPTVSTFPFKLPRIVKTLGLVHNTEDISSRGASYLPVSDTPERPAVLLSLCTPTSQHDTYDVIASHKRPYPFPAPTASTSKAPRIVKAEGLVHDTEDISSRGASYLPVSDTPELKKVRTFTVDTSRRLTTHLLDFCHCDFVLLPCVLEYENFTVDKLQAAVDKQWKASRVWFGAPMELTSCDYGNMTAAAEAIVCLSYVPCLMEEAPQVTMRNEYPWLLRLDKPWRDLLTLLIERVVERCDIELTFTDDTEYKIKVALLEAVRRLSFRDRVELTTRDERIISNTWALQTYTGKEHNPKMNLTIVEEDSPDTDPDVLRIYIGSFTTVIQDESQIKPQILPTNRQSRQQQAEGASTRHHQTHVISTRHQQPQVLSATRKRYYMQTQSIRQQLPVSAGETFWRQCIRDWYPNLHGQTYFLPPDYFNRVPYDVQTVAGLSVLVPNEVSDQPQQVPVLFNPRDPAPQVPAPPLASRVWPDQPVPSGPLPVVYRCDVRHDDAMQQVRHYIRDLAEREGLVMLVLSQLEFRKYLDNQVNPISAAAIRLLPRPATLEPDYTDGDFDVLMINAQYGLIVGEVKSVGADPSKIPDLDKALVKTVGRAVKQLNKQGTVLRHLVSDLPPVKVTKTLMFPNIKSTQLLQALSTDLQIQQALCQCVGVVVTDPAAAVARCLTADRLTSSEWWRRAVTDLGPDSNMSPELYEVIVARFCGPATTIEVPTVTTPRRTAPLRTQSEAVALTGLTTAMLTLYPEQVELVNRPGLSRVFLWGPPGTGKTVILVLKAMQWGQQGKDVHIVSTHRHSRAAVFLIERQLRHNLGGGSTPASTPTCTPKSGPRVHTHFYDIRNKRGVKAAVEELASATRDGDLFVIADEAYSDVHLVRPRGRFTEFCTHLDARVHALHLWAASVERYVTPDCLRVETVTTPVRCPPAIVREVARSGEFKNGAVPSYTSAPAPAATDGPAVRWIRHWKESRYTLSPGHTAGQPQSCKRCADDIATILMQELRVGQPGCDLQYRDVIILCRRPRDNLPVVTSLRARGLPVQVVTSDDDGAAIRDVALAGCDAVTVTDSGVVRGLERRVVVVLGWEGGAGDRLYAMSRCTSLLVCVGQPLESDDSDDGSDHGGGGGVGDDDSSFILPSFLPSFFHSVSLF